MPGGPTVVVDQDFLNQTSGFGPTNLFTPTTDGDFLFCIYANNSGAGSITISLQGSTALGDDSTGVGLSLNGVSQSQATGFFRLLANKSIKLFTTGSGVLDYNVYVEVLSL